MGRVDTRLMKKKYKWGNRYGNGCLEHVMIEYNKKSKKSKDSAQKIRDYFDTPEWHKIKRKNGLF